MIINKRFVNNPSAFENFEDIPPRYRLVNYADRYRGVEVWDDFANDHYSLDDCSEYHARRVQWASECWKEFCSSRDRHYALATPRMVDDWTVTLLEDVKPETAYTAYITYVNSFYRYLRYHIDHPHCYNPVLFAVRMFPTSRSVWEQARGSADE